MNRFHPITAAIVAAVVLVVIGIYFVEKQRPAVPGESGRSWDGITGYLDPVPRDSRTPTPEPGYVAEAQNSGETVVIPKTSPSSPRAQAIPESASEGFDTLLAEIRRDMSRSGGSTSTVSALEEAFSFVPEVTVTIPAGTTRTPEQQSLYEYGNKIGAAIKAFALGHTHMVETLTAQTLDRTSPQKNAAVRTLGAEYVQLGAEISAIKDVPPSIKIAHDSIAGAYTKLGTALSKVPDATDDQTFVASLTAYNNTADGLTNSIVSMSTLLSLKDVTFATSDSGAVFSFQGN